MAERLSSLKVDYPELLVRHAAVHGDLLRRARLDLGGGALALRPSEDLLEMARAGDQGSSGGEVAGDDEGTSPTHQAEAALLEKLFDAGRYAIISSCGDLPPNLQGVWSGTYTPAWSGDYTHNGNVQTALAALLSTSTPELLLGYFSALEAMLADFRHNSRALFGARGVYVPSRFSTHGLQNHFNETWCHEFWTAGAGWAARLFFDYWQYTGDTEFLLDRALPFMEEVAEFYEDFLVEGPDGRLVFVPSLSPENNPANSASQAAVNATMDIAVAKDLLRNLVKVTTELEVDGERPRRWAALLDRLPEYAVDDDGSLAEWAWPTLHNNHEHRHASHLYPVLYEVDPEIGADERLLEACRKAVQLRLRWRQEPGHGEMAFGLAWLGLAAAHLGMADAALEALTMLARGYWRPSLMATHDSLLVAGTDLALFNADICGGLPALVTEMLVQSSVGQVSLLPACPSRWAAGCIEGVACRGRVVVERLTWRPGNLTAAFRSQASVSFTVVLPAEPKVLLVDGQAVAGDSLPASGPREVRLSLEPGVRRVLEAFAL
jgi:hypothetical protein